MLKYQQVLSNVYDLMFDDHFVIEKEDQQILKQLDRNYIVKTKANK